MNFDARIDAILRRMAEEGIELLIACSNGLPMPDLPDPVVHLSGYRSLGESFVLLNCNGSLKLIVSPASDAERAAAWGDSHTCIATDDLIGALTRELLAGDPISGCVAIVGIDSMPHFWRSGCSRFIKVPGPLLTMISMLPMVGRPPLKSRGRGGQPQLRNKDWNGCWNWRGRESVNAILPSNLTAI